MNYKDNQIGNLLRIIKTKNMLKNDRVICISSNSNGLPIIGREYIIYNSKSCPGCNNDDVDIGISVNGYFALVCSCGKEETIINNIYWFKASRFVRIQEKKEYKVIHSEVSIEEPILN